MSIKNKFARHTIAFTIIALASIFLYPTAQARFHTLTWTLLGLVGLAAVFTLITK